MSTENIELKPCPFCGGEAVIDIWNDGSAWIKCENIYDCSCEMGLFDSAKEAADIWNKRT